VKITSRCLLCEDCGWVCERHTEKPWDGQHACRSTKTAGGIELVDTL
jgi:hypothetical protein